MAYRFRKDVRLLRSASQDLMGFQRGREVVWLPAVLGTRLWSNPDDVISGAIIPLLRRVGLVEDAPEHELADRNRIFAGALCEGKADDALTTLCEAMFVLIGCGGLGSSVAVILAAIGARDFVLIDGDVIEDSNLNRLLWADRSNIGQAKVHALAAHLQARFAASVEVYDTSLSRDHLHGLVETSRPTVVILAVDDNDVARFAVQILHRLGLPYVHAGYAGSFCSVGPLVVDPSDPCPFCGAPDLKFVDKCGFIAPSAAPNNLFISAFLSTQLLRWAAKLPTAIHCHRWVSDMVNGRALLQVMQKQAQCPACS